MFPAAAAEAERSSAVVAAASAVVVAWLRLLVRPCRVSPATCAHEDRTTQAVAEL